MLELAAMTVYFSNRVSRNDVMTVYFSASVSRIDPLCILVIEIAVLIRCVLIRCVLILFKLHVLSRSFYCFFFFY